MIFQFIQISFTVFSILIFVRILGSWFPPLQQSIFMRYVAEVVDPYLNFFRRFIPPIGGTIDISPIVAIFSLQFLQYLVTRFLLWAM